MNIALCTKDGRTYEAGEFSDLPSPELNEKRKRLRCPECNGPAFFRKKSSSGQAACFGARPHADGCELATSERDVGLGEQGPDQDILHNPGEHIVVDLDYGAQEWPGSEEGPISPGSSDRGGRFVNDGKRPDAKSTRRLSSLLRMLLEAPSFSRSDKLIQFEDWEEARARNIFVRLDSISESHENMNKGFWGMISDANSVEDGTLWLNSNGLGLKEASFCIDKQHVASVYDRYGIDDEEDIAGAYILVFGTLRVAKSGKLYCSVSDPARMTLRLVD